MKHASTLLAISGLGCILSAGSAFAHAHLKEATPAEMATVNTSPTSLTLDFTEGLNLAFSGVEILNASGDEVQHGRPTLAGDGATLAVSFQSVLVPGTYTVNWHVLSSDGHKTQGSYSFSVRP
ncbi:copper homeostasis periplasmic binding protein CopC [Mesorhizobium sp. B2-8-3]|uniref:copper homeostasis periplasmic binding protein CopC n=1 Tax=Mesorhizobium sp. B2-8-3 TaxID=2589905 RepID=UPI00112E8238|nr:copper homeostasis periplasmic binding protein CopC [Mesorhizobium sp. B2-8-3]TPJ37161.1 copper homeostasis periplasmic binding protein CopC [Mesorhizobium sp. B2-8-3]